MKANKKQVYDVKGMETFGRHLMHEDEYPPEVRAKREPEQQRHRYSTPVTRKEVADAVGDSHEGSLRHFAKHLIHGSEAFLDPRQDEIDPVNNERWRELWERMTGKK